MFIAKLADAKNYPAVFIKKRRGFCVKRGHLAEILRMRDIFYESRVDFFVPQG